MALAQPAQLRCQSPEFFQLLRCPGSEFLAGSRRPGSCARPQLNAGARGGPARALTRCSPFSLDARELAAESVFLEARPV